MRRLRHVPVLWVIALWACASGGPPVTRDPATDPNVITAGELTRATGIQTAWDAVNRLRPRFLRVQGGKSFTELGSGPMVRIDEGPFAELATLRTVEVNRIREIRYYSATDATQRFGGLTGRPVIHVLTSLFGPSR